LLKDGLEIKGSYEKEPLMKTPFHYSRKRRSKIQKTLQTLNLNQHFQTRFAKPTACVHLPQDELEEA